MLKATGERLVPDLQREELLYAEHLARYRLAAQLVEGKRVLDAGCGEGYGAALLAAAGAKSIVGVDVDEPTVEHARERYGLEFRVADVAELPFEDRSFDVVVCFETIEHVADAGRALAELERILAENGLLVVSTPNAHEYTVENEFHVREFTPVEFDELLAEHFPERTWLYQQNWLLSAILDETHFRADEQMPLELDVRKTVSLDPGRELYAVVVCGPTPEKVRQVAVASGVHEAHRLSADLDAWQERAGLAEHQREEWEKRAATAERELVAWQQRAGLAEHQRKEWAKRAREAERQVGETREQLERAEHALNELVASASWRLTAPLRRAREKLGGSE